MQSTVGFLHDESSNFMNHDHLRRPSVFVNEPDPGQVYWVLHESFDDAAVWVDLEAAEQSVALWIDAFDQGAIVVPNFVGYVAELV